MPETQVVDEVVSERAPTARGGSLAARPVVTETVEANTGAAKISRSGIEEETVSEGARKGRVFKESTEKLLAEMDKPEIPPNEVGDADEDEPDGENADAAGGEDVEDGDAAVDDTGESGDGDAAAEGEGEAATPSEADQVKATAARLEARNKELLSELEEARKTPKSQRTERETTLLAAEQSYIEEGTVPALRKFLSVIVGAAPDSKEVSAELAGLYLDLTAQEVGVALDQNQQSLRDNARTRLLLARDKREKADAEKKTVNPDNGADETVKYEQAASYVENLLTTNGSNIADAYPMMAALTKRFDGFSPAETIARAVRHEMMAGTIDPKGSEIDAVRTVAQNIETYYDTLAEDILAARAKKTKKTDTTTPSVKPKVATDTSKEQRKSEGARTITQATASRAPAKPPKTTKQKANTTTEKTRKDFPSDAAWKDHLLNLHFKS